MANGKQIQTTIVINGQVAASLTKALNNVNQQTTRASKKMDSLGSTFARGMQFLGVGLIANEIRQLGAAGLQTASNLAEVQNVVDVTFDQSAKQINAWSKQTLNSFGVSELQAKKYSGTMGAMLKSSGLTGDNMVTMSTHLTELAGDMASFYNLEHDDAWEKIRSGISGETEPLKQLGINMSVANLEAFALTKGIKTQYQNMDQASQTALRYAYLMSVTKDAQGDFARTQDGYANQTRLLKTNIEQLSGSFMGSFLPAFTTGTQKANEFIAGIKPEQVQAFADTVTDGASAAWNFGSTIVNNWDKISPIVYGIAAATGAWKIQMMYLNKESMLAMGISKLSAAWSYATTVISLMRQGTSLASIAQMEFNLALSANPIGLVVVGIGALVAAGVWLYNNWDWVTKGIGSLWQNNVLPIFNGIGSFVTGVFDGALSIIKGYINTYISLANLMISGLNFIKIDIPDWVPAVGGKSIAFNIPKIPMFAKGGFANQPSIFGEAGKEAAIPIKRNNPRSLRLWQDTGRMIGAVGKGMVSLVYSPNINVANAQGVKEVLEEDFEKFKAWLEQYFNDTERWAF